MPRTTLLIMLVLLATALSAQPPQTQTAIFPSPASQMNTPAATLSVSALVQAPGELPSPTLQVMGAGSLSTTLAYVSFGSTTFPAPGMMNLNIALSGTGGAGVTLALSVQPTGTFCGGFAGWPCLTGPLLFGSAATPWGQYHLGPNPLVVFDGNFNTPGSLPAFLDPAGNFTLNNVIIPIDTVTNGGLEQSFAIQALITDPAAPAGLTFTACFTVEQWVFYL